MKVCTTCNNSVSGNYIELKCPQCLKSAIIRCDHCRATSKTYTCPKCGFVGP